MTKWYCMNCGNMLFDNGDEVNLAFYRDICPDCKLERINK